MMPFKYLPIAVYLAVLTASLLFIYNKIALAENNAQQLAREMGVINPHVKFIKKTKDGYLVEFHGYSSHLRPISGTITVSKEAWAIDTVRGDL